MDKIYDDYYETIQTHTDLLEPDYDPSPEKEMVSDNFPDYFD